MPITCTGFADAKAALAGFFDDLDHDLEPVGEQTARLIVSETLNDRGDNDQPFAPYSPGYARQLREAGAKLDGKVDLRGVFGSGPGPGHIGAKPGVIRRATRAPGGVVDPESELSADLIHVSVEAGRITLNYRPRSSPHMVVHQAGGGHMPQRVWFTLERPAIKESVRDMVEAILGRYVRHFNR